MRRNGKIEKLLEAMVYKYVCMAYWETHFSAQSIKLRLTEDLLEYEEYSDTVTDFFIGCNMRIL